MNVSVPKKEALKVIDDVTGHWAESSLRKAEVKGIITGYADGSIKSNDPFTRAQMAVILDRLVFLNKIKIYCKK